MSRNVICVFSQIPHPTFKRRGDDLDAEMTITLLDSLVGFKRYLKHVDGHEVKVEKDDVTYCSEIYKIVGEGIA
jgi:DnaJ-class molecular chaperone